MAKIHSKERAIEYAVDFKIKVVELTDRLEADTIQIAEILGLHPVMVYRGWQEYREGKLVETNSHGEGRSRTEAR